MAIDFPASPANGDVITDATSGNKYTYISAYDYWQYTPSNTGGGGGFYANTTVPASAFAGDQWLDLNTGILYTYVNDGTSSAWIEYNPTPLYVFDGGAPNTNFNVSIVDGGGIT